MGVSLRQIVDKEQIVGSTSQRLSVVTPDMHVQASRMSCLCIRVVLKPNIDVVQEERMVTQVSLRAIDSCVQEGAIFAPASSGNRKVNR